MVKLAFAATALVLVLLAAGLPAASYATEAKADYADAITALKPSV